MEILVYCNVSRTLSNAGEHVADGHIACTRATYMAEHRPRVLHSDAFKMCIYVEVLYMGSTVTEQQQLQGHLERATIIQARLASHAWGSSREVSFIRPCGFF
jgi:hypothetical protein